MKKHDTIGRRDRYEPQPDPNAKAKEVHTDYLLGAYNQKRGGVGLPTWMLTRAGTHTLGSLQHRMVHLRHNLKLFDILPFQRRAEYPRRNALINTNAKKLNLKLKELGLWSDHVPEASGAHYHDAYQGFAYESCIATLPPGWKIEMQHELLPRVGRDSTEIKIDGITIKPDITTRITTPHRTILIFDEIDRATEPNRRMDSVGKSWEPKLKAYNTLIGTKQYKDLFPIYGDGQYAALMRIWTVDNGNLFSVLNLAKEVHGKACKFIAGQAHPSFGYQFELPKGYIDVYNSPWYTAGSVPYIFTQAKSS